MIALVAVGLLFIYGNIGITSVEDGVLGAPKPRVAAIQGNIDQGIKWDPAFQISTTKKYVKMTLAAASSQPDLIVWPETATPFYFKTSTKLTRLVTETVRKANVPLLVGSPSAEGVKGNRTYYNSAYMVSANGQATGRYDKVHLVPFGEYVPLKSLLSFAGKMVAQVGDFSSGEKGKTLFWRDKLPPVGVQICFEIIFPALSRSLVKNGAGLLVNLTNDAWFGKSAAAYQHFSMAVFRAIENRRSLVRCANTGISGVVDPAGRILGQTVLFEDAVVDQAVPILSGITMYTRFGDFLPISCLLVLGILTAISFFRKKKGGSIRIRK
jgi:apolipoprotein N-acyltransferase